MLILWRICKNTYLLTYVGETSYTSSLGQNMIIFAQNMSFQCFPRYWEYLFFPHVILMEIKKNHILLNKKIFSDDICAKSTLFNGNFEIRWVCRSAATGVFFVCLFVLYALPNRPADQHETLGICSIYPMEGFCPFPVSFIAQGSAPWTSKVSMLIK